MNIFCRQISIVITFTSPPLLSQYKVQRTDPLAPITSSLQLFSLEAEDGTTASLRCPSQTKVTSPHYNYITLSVCERERERERGRVAFICQTFSFLRVTCRLGAFQSEPSTWRQIYIFIYFDVFSKE